MNIYQIDEETLSSLPEDVRSKLQAYTPEDVEGLKNTANKLLNEKKALAASEAEARAEVARIQADMKKSKVHTPGDEDKLADALAQLEAARNEANGLKKAMTDGKLDSEAKRMAAELAPSDARRAALLAKEVRNRLQLDGDSFTVLKNGKPTISSLDDLKNDIKQEYDFLIDGTKASGGGATGGNGRAVTNTKTISRKDFDEMDHVKRSSFVRDGGKITDTE